MAQNNHTPFLKKMLIGFMTEPDPLYAMLEWLTNELMKLEAENKVGAHKGEHCPTRTTHFSGTRVRRFDTRLGTIYLLVPKLRKGGYIPFFVTERKRSEQALLQVVQEAFINGVSTRKMERLAQSLGIESLSAGQVSEITKDLNEQVEWFRTRPLEKEYPVIWVDALYEKVRCERHIISMAIAVVQGLTSEGNREILAVEPMYAESEDTYTHLFEQLKSRGVETVWLCISDAHTGLKNAIQKCFLGSSWQRCKVHFMRNILVHIPHKEKESFAAKLKQIWYQPDQECAKQYALLVIQEYRDRFPQAIALLEEGLEDSLQFLAFPHLDQRKISSTNSLERIHKEIRRRTRVVGIFPTTDSYLRLVTSYLIEYTEDWMSSKKYISSEAITKQQVELLKIA
ncbi:MAG: Transposase, Mutator family [Candidatus Atribacteria bacterium ADurb.Bin276]|uniref:Mutator family transposase n=1 Tax=Candidatus Atribacter allofermentans TaxID=1852833 RepID=A0A1V5T4A6_9BACT|nr:MAG: Transposase, Mutator family [Candidatus Atribacteria bacterium ADurb.Bin276]